MASSGGKWKRVKSGPNKGERYHQKFGESNRAAQKRAFSR